MREDRLQEGRSLGLRGYCIVGGRCAFVWSGKSRRLDGGEGLVMGAGGGALRSR